MRIRLADVGEIAPVFGVRRGVRSRSARFPEGGTGGGGTGGTDDGGTDDADAEEEGEGEKEEESDEEDENATVPKSELAKAIKRRDAALAAKRKLTERIAELEKKDENPEDDPVKKANARLINSSTRAVLSAQGVTDKDDQKTIISMLRLDDIDVDDEDGPDEDTIEERIGELRRIFGAAPARRVPRTPTTRDKGGKAETSDPDRARYARIMGRG